MPLMVLPSDNPTLRNTITEITPTEKVYTDRTPVSEIMSYQLLKGMSHKAPTLPCAIQAEILTALESSPAAVGYRIAAN